MELLTGFFFNSLRISLQGFDLLFQGLILLLQIPVLLLQLSILFLLLPINHDPIDAKNYVVAQHTGQQSDGQGCQPSAGAMKPWLCGLGKALHVVLQ